MRTVCGGACGAALGVVLAFALTPVHAQDKPAEAKPVYVGDSKCVKCHTMQHKSWKKTPLASSLKALQPTPETEKELFEKKKKVNLDPAKDYSTDGKCLQCHTTGYGLEGGYPKDPKAGEAAGKAVKSMGAVACEACHGPGSEYVKYKTEKTKENPDAAFTWEELGKMGLVKPDEKVCATCHNKDNPTDGLDTFKFEEARAKVHDHKKK